MLAVLFNLLKTRSALKRKDCRSHKRQADHETEVGWEKQKRTKHAPRVGPKADQPWALGRSPVGAEDTVKTWV
jgi:hypothetical protein